MSSKQENYSQKSFEIFKLLNQFRQNPKQLSNHLKNLKKYLDKNNVLTEPNKIPIQMVEGADVIDEACEYLNRLKPLPAFELDQQLCCSAKEHVLDIGPKGLLSYQSSNGTEPEERISKYGNYVEALGENIDFGPNDALGVIVSLTLDDGEEDRPHRDNIFKSDYKKIGIACGPHKSEYQMCVMDFAYDFQPHDDNPKVDERIFSEVRELLTLVNGEFKAQQQMQNQMNIHNQSLQQNKNQVQQPQQSLNSNKGPSK